ncbi:MAG: hypothetical protein ABIN58_02375, partial [candidate division WOR-3 bacterium]
MQGAIKFLRGLWDRCFHTSLALVEPLAQGKMFSGQDGPQHALSLLERLIQTLQEQGLELFPAGETTDSLILERTEEYRLVQDRLGVSLSQPQRFRVRHRGWKFQGYLIFPALVEPLEEKEK